MTINWKMQGFEITQKGSILGGSDNYEDNYDQKFLTPFSGDLPSMYLNLKI